MTALVASLGFLPMAFNTDVHAAQADRDAVKHPVRIAIAVAVLVAIQAAAYLTYRAVERSRASRASKAPFAAERLRGNDTAPSLEGQRVDGSTVKVDWPSDRVLLVHFWATWCKPCRTELPGLLVLGRELRSRGIEVLAVAVDDDWHDIRMFFDGEVPPEIVVARETDVHKRFGVATLPDTYVVDRAGALVARFHGARDWRAASARDYLLGFVEQTP